MKAACGAQGLRERSTQDVVKEGSQLEAAIRAKLADAIGPERFGLWFGPQVQFDFQGEAFVVRTPSVFVRDWLRQNFRDALLDAAQEVVGHPLLVQFKIDSGGVAAAAVGASEAASGAAAVPSKRAAQASGSGDAKRAAQSIDLPAHGGESGSRRSSGKRQLQLLEIDGERENQEGSQDASGRAALSGRPKRQPGELTLARFAVGPSNEYALRTAQLTAMGRQPASPIIFFGPTGVGKTHLLRGLQAEYRRRFPRKSALYLSAEQFTTAFVESLRGTGLPSFRQKCRGADVLLIDDLQFFLGKQRTIEELQHTIDATLYDGRQLVFSSDRPGSELRGLGAELVSRLAGGLACEVWPPEYVTRVKILRALCEELGLTLREEVLNLVASEVTGGARELRGALHRLEAASFAYGREITREMAEVELCTLARQTTRSVRLGDVQKAVCEVFGLDASQLKSDRKSRSLSEPRMLAMWLARKYTRAAWSDIGEFFGRRSHSTVISAHRRVEKLITTQATVEIESRTCSFEEAIRRIEAVLKTA